MFLDSLDSLKFLPFEKAAWSDLSWSMHKVPCRNVYTLEQKNFFFSWETLITHQARHINLKLNFKRKYLKILRMLGVSPAVFSPLPRRSSPSDGSGGPQVPSAARAFRSGNYLSLSDKFCCGMCQVHKHICLRTYCCPIRISLERDDWCFRMAEACLIQFYGSCAWSVCLYF